MATKLYFHQRLTSERSDYGTGHNDANLAGTATGWDAYSLNTSVGGGATATGSPSTVAGPTAGIEVFRAGSSVPLVFYSPPLNADVTISGSVTWNIWASESTMNDNVAINGRLEVIDGATGTITLIDQTARITEVAITTRAVNNFAETPAAGVACKRGDRLRVRIFGDDAGTMASAGFFTVSTDSASASVDGDTWLQLTENLTFVSEPAGTTIYPTDTASVVSTASVDREAWTSRGAGVQTDVTNTAAGWTSPIQVTDTAGGTVVDWFTRQLTAFTLGGAVRVNARLLESNIAANATIRCEIARVASDGTSPTVWGATTYGIEATTSEAVYSFLVGGDDLAVSDGQRLRIRFSIDDSTPAAMGASQTVTLYYAGTSGGASGDTYLTLTQTLTEFTAGTSANAITATATGDAHLGADAVVATLAVATTTGTANNPTARPGIATVTGIATGTGAALNATTKASANLGVATATGETAGVTAKVRAQSRIPYLIDGAGTAYNATVTTAVSTSATAQVATGTGAAGDTDAAVAAATTLATGTGAALNITANVTANLGAAAGTGAALDADLFPSQVFTAGLATATGAAADATATTAGAATSATAQVATATGAAQDVDAKIAAATGTAAATGAASNTTAKVAVNLDVATATGTAHNADLLPAQLFSAGTATGTGTALDADGLPGTRALAGAAAATGAAADADGAPSDVGPAEVATAAGTAQNLTAKIAPVLQAASATGAALNANVTTTAAGQASSQLAEGTGLAQGTDAVVAATTLAAGAAGTAHNATVTHTAAASATAGVATATGAAHNATGLVSGQAVSVTAGVATGTGTAWPVAQRRRRRPRPTQGYPPSLASRRFVDHVKAYAELAQGFGRAYDAHIEWDDDEAALILLLLDAA